MKRQLLRLANGLLAPLGAMIYRAGSDMETVLKTMGRWPRQPASIIDLGAANGDWSTLALDAFRDARVVGVDPLVERKVPLSALAARYDGQFDFVLAAAGPVAGGTVELAVDDGDLDSSTVNGGGSLRAVPVTTVDAIVAEKGLKGPFFLKFDTHGFEVPILEGATKTLAETDFVVMEAYNFRHTDSTLLFHEMIALMETKGFRVFNLVDVMNRPIDGALWQVDLFFARPGHPIFASEQYRA